jgi:hypothetical protein
VESAEQIKPIPPRRQLIDSARAGGITLVLGAGISMPRGIPSWDHLAQAVWRDAFKDRPSPWAANKQGRSPQELSQFLPIIFELAYRELGERKFLKVLGKNLYAKARRPEDDPGFRKSKESLAVLARLVVAEHRRRGECRIANVITFNADDFFERAVWLIFGRGQFVGHRVVRPVAGSTHGFLGSLSVPMISVYHIHGLVQSKYFRGNVRTLVFTDSQYWSTSASSFAFANRIMTSALSEGKCVFVGLSMTDVNLLRWLALRTLDRDRDLIDWIRYSPGQSRSRPISEFVERTFSRHFWIRPSSDDPERFLADFLRHRGIQAVEIKSWQGESFEELILQCFPARTKK